jgi:hypothetical protein
VRLPHFGSSSRSRRPMGRGYPIEGCALPRRDRPTARRRDVRKSRKRRLDLGEPRPILRTSMRRPISTKPAAMHMHMQKHVCAAVPALG